MGVNKYSITAYNTGDCEIRVMTADKTDTVKCQIQVVPVNLPSPWKFNDINENVGSAVFENKTFTVKAMGVDIWNKSDQFGFLNVDTLNSQSISARIKSQINTDPWAKAGLMFRETADASSSFVLLMVSPSNGIHLQYRDGTGNDCADISYGNYTLPVYLKLDKTDSTFVSYKSSNGINWTTLGIYQNKTFNKVFKLGLAVNSHNTSSIGQAIFDSVKIVPLRNTISSITSISKNENAVNVFPNPVNNDVLNVQINKLSLSDKVNVSCMNLEGRVLFTKKNCPSKFSINMKDYPSGIYVISTLINNSTFKNRIIKN